MIEAVPGHRRPALLSGVACGVLALASLPVFAGPGLVADSADQPPAATGSVVQSMARDPLQLPDRNAVLFASDVNQLIARAAEVQDAPVEPAQPEGRVQKLLRGAMALLGTPYRWGGTSPDGGFDCSGLVNYVFRTTLGIELPRVSRDMARDGERVDRSALAAGDLVFFSRRGKRIDHVGIYLGDGRFVHAPRTGKDVMVSELDSGYWSRRFMQARRITEAGS
jgi:cell wall-associated NlpC family hydrolase